MVNFIFTALLLTKLCIANPLKEEDILENQGAASKFTLNLKDNTDPFYIVGEYLGNSSENEILNLHLVSNEFNSSNVYKSIVKGWLNTHGPVKINVTPSPAGDVPDQLLTDHIFIENLVNLKAQFVVAYALETPINPNDLQAHYVIGVTLSAVASFLDKFSCFSHVQVYKLLNQPLKMNSFHLQCVMGESSKDINWDL